MPLPRPVVSVLTGSDFPWSGAEKDASLHLLQVTQDARAENGASHMQSRQSTIEIHHFPKKYSNHLKFCHPKDKLQSSACIPVNGT